MLWAISAFGLLAVLSTWSRLTGKNQPVAAEKRHSLNGLTVGTDGSATAVAPSARQRLDDRSVRTPRDTLREVVESHGTCPLCWSALDGRMEVWSAPGAVSAGSDVSGVWISAGEPTSADTLASAKTVEQEKGRVCWFGVGEQFKDQLCASDDYESAMVGALPFWNPEKWKEKIDNHASLRLQIRRTVNTGLVVREVRGGRRLSQCQQEWLCKHTTPPLRFLAAPVDLANLEGRRVFTAEQDGAIVGFLTASPIPARDGWLIEQIARTPTAMNGASEALVDRAMRSFAEEGAREVTLGLAPLSQRVSSAERDPLLLAWMRAHGRRFYNFGGIESFKAKLRPDSWRPVYAVVRGRWSLRDLGAVVGAFTGRHPFMAVTDIAARAVRQELRWLLDIRAR